jgi:hypothetical protein
MNFFQRLFGFKANQLPDAQPPVSREPFVDPQPPADALIASALHPLADDTETMVADKRPATPFTYTRPAAIREFLDKDYYAFAHQDAMRNPTAETRDSKLTALGARFRFIAGQALEHLDAQVVSLKQHIILMEGVSDVVRKQQELRLQELISLQEKCTRQMELSLDGEGWMAPVLADYRSGFIAGALLHQRENELLSGLNTLT